MKALVEVDGDVADDGSIASGLGLLFTLLRHFFPPQETRQNRSQRRPWQRTRTRCRAVYQFQASGKLSGGPSVPHQRSLDSDGLILFYSLTSRGHAAQNVQLGSRLGKTRIESMMAHFSWVKLIHYTLHSLIEGAINNLKIQNFRSLEMSKCPRKKSRNCTKGGKRLLANRATASVPAAATVVLVGVGVVVQWRRLVAEFNVFLGRRTNQAKVPKIASNLE